MKSVKFLLITFAFFSLICICGCKKEEPVANYYIHHLFQNIENDDYTLMKEYDELLEGVSEEMAVSFLMEYKGFTISKVDIKKLSDGETVDVNVYYDRKVINLTFILDGGVTETELIDNQLTGKFDDFFIIYDPVKIGYEFDGWSDPVPEAFPSEDYIFKAVWIPLGNIEYKVEHYQQNIKDNDYTLIESDTEIFQGIADTPTQAQANVYKGFSVKEFEQQKIAGDGSTVIRIYYDRYVSTLTFELNGGKTTTVLSGGALHGRYGDNVIIEDPAITGYEFIGWSYDVPSTFPEYDYTFEALFSAYPNTSYKVEHWLQDIYDDLYSLEDTDFEYGATDTLTNAREKNYIGFNVREFEQEYISGDNSTKIKIYYDRKISALTFELNGGTTTTTLYNNSISGRYGAAVEIEDPLRTGYRFSTWSQEVPETFPDYNARFEAYWTPIKVISYKVEHYQQNIKNDEFTLVDTEYKEGTVDTQTCAVAKEYKNFEIPYVNQKNIDGDGSTVIQIYYNRILSTISFELDGGNCASLFGQNVLTGKAGTPLNIENPVKENYTFVKWSPEMPKSIPDHDVTYTALWHYMPLIVHVVYEDINVNYEIKGNLIKVIADEGFKEYKWIVEDVPLTGEKGNSIQIDSSNWCSGVYNIVCSAKKNNILYYTNIQVKKGGY